MRLEVPNTMKVLNFGNWMKHGEIIGWDFVSGDYSISQTLGVSRMTCSCMSRASSSSLSASTACCAYRKLMRANKYMRCTNANFNKNINKPWYCSWNFSCRSTWIYADYILQHWHFLLRTIKPFPNFNRSYVPFVPAPSFQAKRLQPTKGGDDTRIGQDEKSHTWPGPLARPQKTSSHVTMYRFTTNIF